MSAFQSDLVVKLFRELPKPTLWMLREPLVYQSDVLKQTVTVPVNFVTDFASIPHLPVVYLEAGGKGDRAAVVHDWLYSTEAFPRPTADAVLREALLATGYSAALAGSFYWAVRWFGGSHWKKPNQKQSVEVAAKMTGFAAMARVATRRS